MAWKAFPLLLGWVLLSALDGVAQPLPEPPLEDLFQDWRREQMLPQPRRSPELDRSAGRRAQTLADGGELSHADAEGRGPGLQQVGEGADLGVFGEVLAAGARIETVWAAWLRSPSHRAILADPSWTRWGWGSVERGETRVWVVRFWKP